MKPRPQRSQSQSAKHNTTRQKRKAASFNTSSSAVDDSFVEPTQQVNTTKRTVKRAKKNNQEVTVENSTRSSTLHKFFTVDRRHSTGEVGLMSTQPNTTSLADDAMQESQALFSSSTSQKEVTMNDIMMKLESNSGKMDKIHTSIERLESSLFTLQLENDKLRQDMSAMKKEGEKVKETAYSASFQAQGADERSNDNEQYCRNYNLRIYNVPEQKDETSKQCEEAVLKLFHEKLKLKSITARDLDAVHRLGQKNSDGPRCIIVRFVSRKTRTEVISQRRLLKKQPGQSTKSITIVDDLTKKNYVLYQRARMAETTKECWTVMGKIFVKNHRGVTRRIKKERDITELDKTPSSRTEHQNRHMDGRRDTRGNHSNQGYRSRPEPSRGDDQMYQRRPDVQHRSRPRGRGRGVSSKSRSSRFDYQRSLTRSCDSDEWLTDGANSA